MNMCLMQRCHFDTLTQLDAWYYAQLDILHVQLCMDNRLSCRLWVESRLEPHQVHDMLVSLPAQCSYAMTLTTFTHMPLLLISKVKGCTPLMRDLSQADVQTKLQSFAQHNQLNRPHKQKLFSL